MGGAKTTGKQHDNQNNFIINVILNLDCHDGGLGRCSPISVQGPPEKGSRLMDIYLHLGAHRCANQTFHSFLNANATALDQKGITVWSPARTRNGMMRGLVRAPEKITIEDERQAVRSIGRMRVELIRLEREGRRGVLISDADLLGNLGENLNQTSLYPLLNERLMRLLPAFENRPLYVGISLRSYAEFWTSALARGLAQGRSAPTDGCLDFLTTQPRHWRNVIGDVAKAFPHSKVMAWPFERFAGRPWDVLRELTGVGLPDTSVAAEWLGRSGDLRQLNNLMEACGAEPLAMVGFEKGARWMPFSDDHQRVLRAEYRRDLTWLQAGAQGLARYIDGRQTPAMRPHDRGQIHNDATVSAAPSGRGQTDGIKKRMG